MRPIDVALQLCPRAKKSYLAAIENGDLLFKAHGITTPLRLAHFFAQIMHESGGLSIEWESGAYSAGRLVEIFGEGRHSAAISVSEAGSLAHNGRAIFERVYGQGNPRKARELGNTQPGDGYRYRGGGLMQTTGRYNYRIMGQKCGVDFEANPTLVLSAEHALKPALAEWTSGHLNDFADHDDILSISRKINLGNTKSTGTPNGMADRRVWLLKLKRAITVVNLEDRPTPTKPSQPLPPSDVDYPKDGVPSAPAKAPNARNATTGTTIVAAIIAALQSNKIEVAIGVVVVGVLIAIAVHFLWPKKKT